MSSKKEASLVEQPKSNFGSARRRELIRQLWTVIQDNVRQIILDSNCDRHVAEERVLKQLISSTPSPTSDSSTSLTHDSVWAISQTEATRALLIRRELALLGDAGFSPNDSILQLISRLNDTTQRTSSGVLCKPDSLSELADLRPNNGPHILSSSSSPLLPSTSPSSASPSITSSLPSISPSTSPSSSSQTTSSGIQTTLNTSPSPTSLPKSPPTSFSILTSPPVLSLVRPTNPSTTLERIPLHGSATLRVDHSVDPSNKYGVGSTKIFPRSRKNSNKRKKGKRKQMDVRVDVVELDMVQDPVMDNTLDLDREAMEKIKSSRFPRLR